MLSLSLQNVKFMPAERRILHVSQIIHPLLKIDILKVETVVQILKAQPVYPVLMFVHVCALFMYKTSAVKDVNFYLSGTFYLIYIYIYRVYQKKGNRTLQCSSTFIIQSTEIILSQAKRPGF